MTLGGPDALIGVGLYAVVCAVMTAAGNGLLKALGARADARLRHCLAPAAAVGLWAVLFGLTGACRVPVRVSAPWVGGLTLLLGCLGCVGRPRGLLPSLPLLLLCAGLPLVGMREAFQCGLTEYGPALGGDGWRHVAAGRCWWDFGRASPPEQSALPHGPAPLPPGRYVPAALLGFLSGPHNPGETARAAALYQAALLFAAGCGVCFFWLAEKRPVRVAAAAAAVTVLCGWTLKVVRGSDFDTELLLALAPALAGVPAVTRPGQRASWLLPGLLTAAGAYVGAAYWLLVCVGCGLLVLPGLWAERRAWGAAGVKAPSWPPPCSSPPPCW
jgi:hypothetical protein